MADQLVAKSYAEALELAWQHLEKVYVDCDNDRPIRCSDCKAIEQIGIDACSGCCRL